MQDDILNSLRSVAAAIRKINASGGSAISPADIRKIRSKLTLTQESFADKLGVSTETVRSWELGRRKPGLLALVALVELEDRAALNELEPA